jgi:hypothetical protein
MHRRLARWQGRWYARVSDRLQPVATAEYHEQESTEPEA